MIEIYVARDVHGGGLWLFNHEPELREGMYYCVIHDRYTSCMRLDPSLFQEVGRGKCHKLNLELVISLNDQKR